MSWEKTTIGKHCEITSSKRIFFSDYTDHGIPFFRSKEIIEMVQHKDISESLFISQEKYDEIAYKFGVPSAGDLLLTSVGTIGIPYIIKESDHFYFKDGNLTWFRNFDTGLLSAFLYYWFLSDEGIGVLNNSTIGSSQKALTISNIKKIQIPLFPLNIQSKIVSILSAYDSLIENNQKQIKLLEEAAQRLYKEWFVDLRFPGWENTKIVDGVPEGWEKTTFGHICTVKKHIINIQENIPSDTPYIGLEHMPRHDFCLSEWGYAQSVSSSKLFFKKGDILFGKIRPYFHKVGFAICNGICSTDAIVMSTEKQLWSLLLMTASSDEFVNHSYQTCKEGSKMPRADWRSMELYPVLIATHEMMNSFNLIIESICSKIEKLALENNLLRESLDVLLQKIMRKETEV
mgnify:FL=1